MVDDRHDRGLKKLREIDGAAGERVIESLKDIAPDLARYTIEFAFGDVYSRPGLDLKAREIATVAALTALGNATAQLKVHIHGALNVGCSRQELVEVIIQMAVYAGWDGCCQGDFSGKRQCWSELAPGSTATSVNSSRAASSGGQYLNSNPTSRLYTG